MEADKRKRIGRPTTPGAEGEKSTLSVRASAALKQKLDAAANAAGRSLSQEAELRLEQSLASDRLMVDAMQLLYGRAVAGLMLELGDLMSEVGRDVGFEMTKTLSGAENWLSNPTAYDEALKAAVALLEAIRPVGEIVPLKKAKAPAGMADLQKALDQRAEARGVGAAHGHAALLIGEIEIGGAVGEKIELKRTLLGTELIERLRVAVTKGESR